MRLNFNGNGQVHALVNSNTIREAPVGRGVEIIGRNGTGQTDVTVTNNNVDHTNLTFDIPNASNTPLAAILVQSNCVTVCYHVRTDVRLNTVPAVATAADLAGSGYLQLIETTPGGSTNPPSILELVDTGAPDASCAGQLTSNNTGSVSVAGGCSLIAGPISTPP
jgi:hypothetical protein